MRLVVELQGSAELGHWKVVLVVKKFDQMVVSPRSSFFLLLRRGSDQELCVY